MNYLVDVDIDSRLTGVVVGVVNALVRALYLKEAQQADVVNLDGEYAGLKLMADGDLLYVNLLGLKIGASLCKNDSEYNTDAVIVTIGSSTVKLPCDDQGLKKDSEGAGRYNRNQRCASGTQCGHLHHRTFQCVRHAGRLFRPCVKPCQSGRQPV